MSKTARDMLHTRYARLESADGNDLHRDLVYYEDEDCTRQISFVPYYYNKLIDEDVRCINLGLPITLNGRAYYVEWAPGEGRTS